MMLFLTAGNGAAARLGRSLDLFHFLDSFGMLLSASSEDESSIGQTAGQMSGAVHNLKYEQHSQSEDQAAEQRGEHSGHVESLLLRDENAAGERLRARQRNAAAAEFGLNPLISDVNCASS